MPSDIVRRIERETALPGLADALTTKLPASDLHSLMMEVFRVRSNSVKLFAFAAQDPLLTASSLDARILMTFDRAAFAAALEFDALDLSPVCPFGASFALGGTSQNNILTTIRNAEILGDSTISM